MNSGKLIRSLSAAGWVLVRVRGSHYQFTHPGSELVVTVPHPKKDLPMGTVNHILKTSGLK